MTTNTIDFPAAILPEDASFHPSPIIFSEVPDIAAAAPVIYEDSDPAAAQPMGGEMPLPADDPASPDIFEWHGVPLHPFTSTRAGIFYAHRLVMGAPPIHLAVDDVNAWLGDAFTILWLCLHSPADWAELRRSPVKLQLAIDAWADENVTGSEAPEAVLLALRVYAESRQ